MNPTLGMRHAVLWVTDTDRSAEFYRQALGLVEANRHGQAIFLSSPNSTTDHDLGLFPAEGPVPANRSVGLYHIAWEVETLTDLVEAKARLAELGALVGENNHGMSRSLYCHDPDGIEFEVMWEVPVEQYDPDEPANIPLDLEADIARFGATSPGRGGPAPV